MRCGRDGVDSSAPLSPPRILVSLGGLECFCPEPVVLDADDFSVAQSEDIEDLTVKRLAPDLVERGTSDTHHQSTASSDELQCRHIATKPEPLLQCLR